MWILWNYNYFCKRKERGNSQGIRLSKDVLKSAGIGLNEIPNTGPLHIWTSVDEEIEGYIQCEKLTLLDLSIRGHKKIGRISMPEVVNVSDAIQGIFDYV